MSDGVRIPSASARGGGALSCARGRQRAGLQLPLPGLPASADRRQPRHQGHPYFRHAADSDCVEGFLKGVLLKAREIVQEAQRLLVPAFEETVRDYAYSKVYTRQVKLLAVEAARMEVESTIQISRSIRPSSRRSRCKCRRTCSTCHRHAIA